MGIHYSIHKLQEAPTVEAVELVVDVSLLRHVVILAELEDANSVVGAAGRRLRQSAPPASSST